MGGGPFTYEKFVNSLSETISRNQMPDQNLIKVKKKRIFFFFDWNRDFRIFTIILKILN